MQMWRKGNEKLPLGKRSAAVISPLLPPAGAALIV
jgi:hypothetical protein